MFDRQKSILLDIVQLDFVKQQIGFYPHELIGKTITISTTEEIEFTASFRIAGASTHRFTKDEEKEVGWRVHINLESNVVWQWTRYDLPTNHLFELLVFDVTLYIRREEDHKLELNLVKRNILTNQFELVHSGILGGYAIV